jgi:hypothetical protein
LINVGLEDYQKKNLSIVVLVSSWHAKSWQQTQLKLIVKQMCQY